MRRSLQRHPGSPSFAIVAIAAEIARPRADRLLLSYDVTGKMDEVRVPPLTAAARADELWRHTCFEAFLRAASGPAYYEFNFAPSTLWAAYRFGGYRSGVHAVAEIGAPPIEVRSHSDRFTLQAAIDLARLPDLPPDTAWHLGLSAVIEHANGGLSYWALAHPPGKPDFHHADCFAHELAPAVRA